MKSDLVCALDLGSTKVTLLAAKLDSSGVLQTAAVAIAPCRALKKGVIIDPEEGSSAISTVIRRVEHELGEPLGPLVVGISGSHLKGTSAQGFRPIFPVGRQITHQDVLEVLNHSRAMIFPPDREQIQALPREFKVDYQNGLKQPIGLSGGKLEVTTYLVTGKTSDIQGIERVVAKAGHKVDQIVVASLASGLAVLSSAELEQGAVVIDIGGDLTQIAVFNQGSLAFIGSVPLGGMHVTNDLSQLLRTSVEEAERLKTLHGAAIAELVSDRDSVDVLQNEQPVPRPLQRKVLCEIIESRMREIATLSAQVIELSGLPIAGKGGIVLTGGGSLLPGTERVFEDIVKLKARMGEPIGIMNLPKTPGLATAVGLAKFAMQSFDELEPATGIQSWREKVKSLFSIVTGI